jgi:protein-arginine kinase activator protein McsA
MNKQEAIAVLEKYLSVMEKQQRYLEEQLKKAERLENYEEASTILSEINKVKESSKNAIQKILLLKNLKEN